MDFINFPKQVDAVPDDGSVYADIINHCRDYRNFMQPGSKTTSAHECTHGINNAIRNEQGGMGKVNAFYVRQNRAAVLPEPPTRKSDCIRFIPVDLHGPRFDLYVQGQTDWESCPLYLFDEWTAYVNNGWTAIDLIKRNAYDQEKSDEVYACVEFIPYVVGTLMAADAANALDPKVVAFTKWQLTEAFNAYFTGRQDFDFPGQDQIYQTLKSGPSWANHRAFLQAKLDFVVPDRVGPAPNHNKLTEDAFKVIGL